MQLRFVGNYYEVWDTRYKFDRFGQVADVEDKLAQKLLDEGAPFIKASEWDQFGFTVEELKKYNTIASHKRAPQEFQAKRDAAWKYYQTKGESKPVAPVAPVAPKKEEPKPITKDTEQDKK